MNQVIFADHSSEDLTTLEEPFYVGFNPVTDVDGIAGDTILDKPNEDFVISYKTPSKTVKTIEVNRETLSIQKVDSLDVSNGGEYHYVLESITNASDNSAVQIILQDSVPHQRNSWYIEIEGEEIELIESFLTQLKNLSISSLLDLEVNVNNGNIVSSHLIEFKGINCSVDVTKNIVKSPYQYIKSLLEKNVQNLGYNHTDNNLELNSGLADYKAWMSGTESDANCVVYRLRFATNRKASKTRDERVWQNVYICTKGEENDVAALLDDYIDILNGEGGE